MRSIVLASLALLAAFPARADWQFAKWGMTPEQLVAASSGKAHLLPPGERKAVPPLVSSAEGSFQDGALALRTVFSFDIQRGTLVCVFYGVENEDQSPAFVAMMLKRHGTPTSRSGVAAIGMETLSWRTATDSIEVMATPGDAAFALHCMNR